MATVLLLHMDGADGSTVFTDSGVTGHTVAAQGSAQIDTDQSVFGGASGMIGVASTSDYLTIPDHADFALGSNDFTMDFRVMTQVANQNQRFIAQHDAANNHRSFMLHYVFTGPTLRLNYSSSGTDNSYVEVSWNPSTGVFYHIACVRSGNDLRFFVDGTQQGATQTLSATLFDSTSNLCIGAQESGGSKVLGSELNGWLDELRIINGRAVWTSDFTPPAYAYGTIEMENPIHSQIAEEPTITIAAIGLLVDAITHAQKSGEPSPTQKQVLSLVEDVLHDLKSQKPQLIKNLIIEAAKLGIVAEELSFPSLLGLFIHSATHGNFISSISFNQLIQLLGIDSVKQDISLEEPSLAELYQLLAESVAQAVLAKEPDIASAIIELIMQDASSGMVATESSLYQLNYLISQNAVNLLPVGEPVPFYQTLLILLSSVDDAIHGIRATDQYSSHILSIANSIHSQTAAEKILILTLQLAIENAKNNPSAQAALIRQLHSINAQDASLKEKAAVAILSYVTGISLTGIDPQIINNTIKRLLESNTANRSISNITSKKEIINV